MPGMTIEKRAVKKYGTTEYPELAGYLITSGELLDFSEGANERTLDHRDIATLYRASSDACVGLIRFIQRGNIRISPESVGIEVYRKPTAQQMRTLRGIARDWGAKNMRVDISTSKGKNSKYIGNYFDLLKYIF